MLRKCDYPIRVPLTGEWSRCLKRADFKVGDRWYCFAHSQMVEGNRQNLRTWKFIDRITKAAACVARAAMVKWLCALVFVLAAMPCWAQTIVYNGGNTSVTPVALPATLPCWGPSIDCTGSASLIGAGTTITPTDFNNPITRITDDNTACGPLNANRQFAVNSGGSAEVNFMNTTDTLFTLQSNGGYICVFYSATGNPLTASLVYANGSIGYLWWSFQYATISYDTGLGNGTSPCSVTTDQCLYQWNFSTPASPTETPLVDLTSCASAQGVSGLISIQDFTGTDVTDNYFGAMMSTTSGQGSIGAHYLVVYSQSAGTCRVFDTGALSIVGGWGSTGTPSNSTDAITLHNMRMSKNGADVKFAPTACIVTGTASFTNGSPDFSWVSGDTYKTSGWSSSEITVGGTVYTLSSTPTSTTGVLTADFSGTTNTYTIAIYAPTGAASPANTCNAVNVYVWNIVSTNDYLTLNNDGTGFDATACGHQSIGYAYVVNHCNAGGHQNWYKRISEQNSVAGTSLPANFPSADSGTLDDHPSEASQNSMDTNPFFTSTHTGTYAVVNAWDNEAMTFDMSGTGIVRRWAHTFSSGEGNFTASNAIGAISQDGKYIAWATDYDGNFCTDDNATCPCTPSSGDCRGDVVMMALPLAPNTAPAKVIGSLYQSFRDVIHEIFGDRLKCLF
jgi:hypothetical protein